MNDVVMTRREADALRRRLQDAEQALGALSRGEVDAVASEAGATPLLLRAAQKKSRENERLLRAVFDGALDAMLLADDEGTYVDANPAACELFALQNRAPRPQRCGVHVLGIERRGSDVGGLP